ncbi:hypothetical protein [uncultured Kordia sp.]|uniref:hypothetical protein n=1 Tax=uncultured Kordia sp. TaxID=507699 RepID=UPI0026048A29|nr:hypothetical protein [uncultured Kordia sp.]
MSHQLKFNSFEELENHLRNCIHWNATEDIGQYDTVGITTLLVALLENLEENTHESQYEDLKQMLSKQHINFLEKLLK